MEDDLNNHVLHLSSIFGESKGFYERLKNEVQWETIQWTRGPLPRLCARSVQLTSVGSTIVSWLQNFFLEQLGCDMQVVDVFGNFYRNGNDYLPQHRDNYDVQGVELHVVSISFGASRHFDFKSGTKLIKSYQLEAGDVIVFDPHMNKKYTHGISKSTTLKEGRINLTCFVLFDKLPYGKKPQGKALSADELLALQLQNQDWIA